MLWDFCKGFAVRAVVGFIAKRTDITAVSLNAPSMPQSIDQVSPNSAAKATIRHHDGLRGRLLEPQ